MRIWGMRALVRFVCVALGALLLVGVSSAAPAFAERDPATVIEIWKARRRMELRSGRQVLRQFHVALGQEPRFSKRVRGDNRTPEGRYYISEKKARSGFRKFLGLSYPNIDDAERGYSARLIDVDEWAEIFFANLRGRTPTWRTLLGGRVGIHGYGGRPLSYQDWTEGCIAVSDEEIDYLYDRVSVGTIVIINE